MPARPVLITVDDDRAVSRAVARDLRRHHGDRHRIMRAESGADALAVLSELPARGELTLRTRAGDDAVFVEVADDGTGVPEDVRGSFFDAFVTTEPTGAGSGLGLENARRIVERRHGGSLSYPTGPEGTTFCVRLPLRRSR